MSMQILMTDCPGENFTYIFMLNKNLL
jgi:hypothetical protein